MTENIQSFSKITKIGAGLALQPSRDVFTILGDSWMGRIYRKHLKKYVYVRRLVLWTWRNGYPLYANHLAPRIFNRKALVWRQIISLNDLAKRKTVLTYKLVDAANVEMQSPKVFPASDEGYLVLPKEHYVFPEMAVVVIKNAMTYGGTNLVLAGSDVICHDLYDFSRDYTSEELHGRTLIDPSSNRIRWLLHDNAPEVIPIAATFVDACAGNYAHWMTEVLSRIAIFCEDVRFKSVPIVVNDGLHKNIMESLLLVVGSDREIITLPIGRAIAVGELYLTSAAGYVPFERRANELSGHSQGIFSPHALEKLRTQLTQSLPATDRAVTPEKIFLRRNSSVRKLAGVDEVENLLNSLGYTVVEPEKLTFSQQVMLFHNAKAVVSPTGAGLVSAIFCKPGTQVAVLMSKHKDMIYRYWSNMLSPLGISVGYALGEIIENDDLGIHGDFKVETQCIVDLLESLEKK